MFKRHKAPEESEWDAPFIYLSDDDDTAAKKPTLEVSTKRNPRRINVLSSSDEETPCSFKLNQTVKTESRQHTAARTVSVSCSSDRGIQLGDCYQSLIARGKTSIFAYSPLPTTNNLQNHAPRVVIDLEDENNPPILYPQSLSKIKTDINASKSCLLATPPGQRQPVSLDSHDPWKSIPDGFTTPQSSLICIATQSLSNRSKTPAKKVHKAKRTKPAAPTPVVLTQDKQNVNADSDADGPKKKSQRITPAVPVVARGPPDAARLRTNPIATHEIPAPPQQRDIACSQSADTFVAAPVDTAPDLVSGEEMTLSSQVIAQSLENRNEIPNLDESKLSDPSPNELSDRIDQTQSLRLEAANGIPANDEQQGDSSNPIASDDTPLVSGEVCITAHDPKATNIDEGKINFMNQPTQDSGSELYLDSGVDFSQDAGLEISQDPNQESEPEIIDSLHKIVSMTLSKVNVEASGEVSIKKIQPDTLTISNSIIDLCEDPSNSPLSSETPKRIIRTTLQAETPDNVGFLSATNDQVVVDEDLSEIEICSSGNSKEKEITNPSMRSSLATQAESMSSAIEFEEDDLEDQIVKDLSRKEVQNLDPVNDGDSADRINSSIENRPLEIIETEKASIVAADTILDELSDCVTKVSPQCQAEKDCGDANASHRGSEALFLSPEESSKTRRHETEGGESTTPGSENTVNRPNTESKNEKYWLTGTAVESMTKFLGFLKKADEAKRASLKRARDESDRGIIGTRPAVRRKVDGWRGKNLSAVKARSSTRVFAAKKAQPMNGKTKPRGGGKSQQVSATNDNVTNDEDLRGKSVAGKLGGDMVHEVVQRSISSRGVQKVVWVSCTGTPVYFSQNDYSCYYANYS